MKGFGNALWCEAVKAGKSKMLWITILVFVFVGLMMGLIMLVSLHPEYAGKSAILSTKASFIKRADWQNYFGLFIQIILTLGTMAFGVVAAWVFGREYSDRTINDLLALPVSRFAIVTSKFIIVFIWCIILTLTIFIVGVVMGISIHIGDWTAGMLIHYFKIFVGSGLLTLICSTPVAFIASYGRGFLLAIGFAIFILILTQFVFAGVPGITPYFPWAIPALYSGLAGPDLPRPEILSYFILIITSLLGYLGTATWWQYADQK